METAMFKILESLWRTKEGKPKGLQGKRQKDFMVGFLQQGVRTMETKGVPHKEWQEALDLVEGSNVLELNQLL